VLCVLFLCCFLGNMAHVVGDPLPLKEDAALLKADLGMTMSDEPCGCAWDWDRHGGHLYRDCCECSPCCGDPCNCSDCCYFTCCLLCCSVCMNAKLYAYSMDQECAIGNHCCLPVCLNSLSCNLFFGTALRSNLRSMHGIGNPGCNVGDCLVMCCWCTGCCAFCQNIRSVPKEGWDWVNGGINCCVEPILICRPTVVRY
jgi:hypothetical protein